MDRRTFCFGAVSLVLKYREFVFKIKTKRGQVVYVTVQGKDLDNAKAKLMQRYPGCTVLSSREKNS